MVISLLFARYCGRGHAIIKEKKKKNGEIQSSFMFAFRKLTIEECVLQCKEKRTEFFSLMFYKHS